MVILVVGAMRSGTTLVTWIINQAGVPVPSCSECIPLAESYKFNVRRKGGLECMDLTGLLFKIGDYKVKNPFTLREDIPSFPIDDFLKSPLFGQAKRMFGKWDNLYPKYVVKSPQLCWAVDYLEKVLVKPRYIYVKRMNKKI